LTRAQHWETVYASKADNELSWFQPAPTVSLALIQRLSPPPRSAIDIGGGQSALAGELLRMGVEDVSVLDISSSALERARKRLGQDADRVRWIVGDALEARDLRVDLWHDRAVFHFLIDEDERRRYAQAASSAVRPGGHAIIATFAPTGPEKCSGLLVRRYDADALAAEFADGFTLVESATETHATPWGKAQDFTYALLRRRGADPTG
jgi:SAM-dependent methyltransferase